MGQLETSLPRRDGAREGPFLVSEQLGLDNAFRQGRAIDLDEGLTLAPRKLVDRPGKKLLAGACFTADQHGSIRLGNLLDPVGNSADRPALADDACQLRACRFRRLERRKLLGKPVLLDNEPLAVFGDDAMKPERLSRQGSPPWSGSARRGRRGHPCGTPRPFRWRVCRQPLCRRGSARQ